MADSREAPVASPLARCTGGSDVGSRTGLADAPFVAHDPSACRYTDLLSPSDADELLTSRGLRHPHLRIVRDGAPLPRSEYTARRSVGGVSFDDLIDPARATDEFRRGATLVFQSLHTHWPALGAFCAELSVELGHPCQANAYLSPHEARGLDVHYDTHDVFALQVSGTKEWEVFAAVFPRPLGHQAWSAVRSPTDPEGVEAPGEPLLTVTLQPGDSLFVPRGFVHRARTTSNASLHVTIGVHARTWHAALTKLVERAARDERFRATLPSTPQPEDLDGFRRLLHAWVDDQDLGPLTAFDPGTRLTQNAAYHRGVLVDSLAPVDDATVVQLRTDRVELSGDDHEVALRTPDRVLRFPARAQPALEAVLEGEPHPVAALADHLDPASRVVLVRRLLAEGVLRVIRASGASGHGSPGP